ncbi:activator of HSP90 ATPase [Cellvibrio zantedeschiae]|uniref:Activator of HSP90 ATPase n=1 Tax=Cellvibrio zantedeschiae TaxID=1237077 RepID=A0ABQ3AMD4_9GAMM|nr:SRPBCC domain-containing protein [Cellvibrio zantedeschiae]GGY61878.1 activator of HSP90 ATPase [Cellvibrio zantedeschiae]
MNHYQQSFICKTTPAKVYDALTSLQGLQGWWTQECTGSTTAGGTLHFRFGNSYKDMRIESLEPNREVRWLCTLAHIEHERLTRKDEWVGTQIVFRLTPDGSAHTRVDFDHIGLVPGFECYDLCKNGWNYFLKSLQSYTETGEGTPFESGNNCEEKTAMGSR